MAEINPAYALQNRTDHTAQNDRNMLNGLIAGIAAASSMKSRGGVNGELGGALKVQAQGSPAMAVDVLSGIVYMPGTEGPIQGTYEGTNDATKTLSITASHATLNRIDLVVAKVEDQVFSGGVNAWSLVVVTGTPASSPVAPTVPNNAVVLAQIAVNANVTQILNANITDKRNFVAAQGGVIPYLSTSPQPDITLLRELQLIGDLTNKKIFAKSGSSYLPVWDAAREGLDIGFSKLVVKPSDETVNNSAVLQSDDHLLFPVLANASYIFDVFVFYSSNTTADIKFAFTFPAAAVLSWGPAGYNAAGVNFESMFTTAAYQAAGDTSNALSGGTDFPVGRLTGIVRVGVNAGNVQLRWAQAVATGINTIVKADSFIRYERYA